MSAFLTRRFQDSNEIVFIPLFTLFIHLTNTYVLSSMHQALFWVLETQKWKMQMEVTALMELKFWQEETDKEIDG